MITALEERPSEKTFTKAEVLALIKSVDIKVLDVPESLSRKSFEFGAYDALRTLSETVKEK